MKSLRLSLFTCWLLISAWILLTSGCAGVGGSSTTTAPSTPPGGGSGGGGGGTGGGGGGGGTPPSSTELVYSIVGTSVSGFTVQPDAKLKPISGIPSNNNLDNQRLVISPDAKWLFTVTGCPPMLCSDRGAVFIQSIGSDGQLGAPHMVISSDQRIEEVIVDQTSHFLYARSEVDRVPPIEPSTGCSEIVQALTAYGLNTDGTLTPLSSSVRTVDINDCPISSGGFPMTRVVGFRQDTAGNFLWLTQIEPGRGPAFPFLLSIPVAADGKLGAVKKTDINQFTQTERSVIAGQFLVTTEDAFRMFIAPDTVTAFRLQNGDFQFAAQCPTTVPACHNVIAMAASPNGKFIYTVSGGDNRGGDTSSWLVNALALDSATGTLAPVGKPLSLPRTAITFGNVNFLPARAMVDSEGRFLFVSRSGDATLTAIALDSTAGTLGTAVDSPAQGTPNAIAAAIKK